MLLMTSLLIFLVVRPAMATVCEDHCSIVFAECLLGCNSSGWAWLRIKEVLCTRRCNAEKADCYSECMNGNVA
ncbi:hypothetical protein NP493_1749g00067 [Ridgeia piscesae]|uniref:Uncharacterized protein n=1 Tax=Ridgeia piscesae TaxID=27915 RepID=A0AAD9JUW6_RIDPI|nr:hypothetical protein NP493_1749g00067 [Ridgeia piscesae]